MREMLFRGKRIDNGEWVYGYYFEEIGCFIKERPSSISTITFLVAPSTVGQYTGLTDKNGAKIFEGDKLSRINQYNNNEIDIFIIEWNEQAGGFYLNYIYYDEIYNLEEFWPDSEVIGNIYEVSE